MCLLGVCIWKKGVVPVKPLSGYQSFTLKQGQAHSSAIYNPFYLQIRPKHTELYTIKLANETIKTKRGHSIRCRFKASLLYTQYDI